LVRFVVLAFFSGWHDSWFVAMRRLLPASILVAFAVIVVLLLWGTGILPRGSSAGSQPPATLPSAIASIEEFVKNRVTGGIGAALAMDGSNRFPVVMTVLPGSPAEKAGLHPRDVITRLGDWPTAGQPLAQVVEKLRGITGGRVTVEIQRQGSTNLVFVIQRSSWNALHVTNSLPMRGSGPVTNLVP
jgi:PDZ domain